MGARRVLQAFVWLQPYAALEPHVDHFRCGRRQLGDLIHVPQYPFRKTHFCMTTRATLRFHNHDPIRLRHEMTLMLGVPHRRSMSALAPIRWQAALLISGWRLRRIARIDRRFLALLQFQTQRFIVGFQLLQLFDLGKDQLDQFVMAHLSHELRSSGRIGGV